MKTIQFLVIVLVLLGCKDDKHSSTLNTDSGAQEKSTISLLVIEQDYDKALHIASRDDKLLFIDFYTSWCAPCKVLDEWVFQKDSIRNLLGKDFVLLKYNAEIDTIFHLSKKHHVSSYPTGIILNKDGYVLNRQYGFVGKDPLSLQKNVLEFTNESLSLNKDNNIISGYSNQINPSQYPGFYNDFINRTNTKIKKAELNDFFINTRDKFSEEYFSTLIYFGRNAPVSIADWVLKNKQKYMRLYGKKDVETLLYFLASAKFNIAIAQLNQDRYEEAVEFTKNALSKGWVDDIIPSYHKDYLQAQNKWEEVFEINEKLKAKGEFDNGYVNHFSWQVYEKCDNQDVIAKCIAWMKEVTDQEPNYAYLDTYAHLMYKSGNKRETEKIAKLAIEAAKQENKSATALEQLMKTL